MEQTTSTGERIRSARRAAGLSLRALAERLEEEGRIDLSHTALHRIETGQRRVATHELDELARVLDVAPMSLLRRPGRTPVLALAARVSEESGPGREVATCRAVQVLETQDLLERLVGPLPIPNEATIDFENYPATKTGRKRMADDLRTALGLGDGPIGGLPELIESYFGAHVLAEPLPHGQHGFCVVGDRVDGSRAAVIMVNSDDDPGRQRFTLAHELAHLLVGDATVEVVAEDETSRSERLAQYFAGYFLAPESGLRRELAGRTPDAADLGRLAHTYNMSVHAMAVRLSDYRLIPRDKMDELLSEGAGRSFRAAGLAEQWRDRQTQKGHNVPPRRLLAQAVQAHVAGIVGVGLVADVLGTDSLTETVQWLHTQGFDPVAPEQVGVAALI